MDARVTPRGTGDDLDQLAHKFNRMLSKIETLIQAMGEALDNVAHDLSPLLARMRISIEKSVEDGENEALMNSLMDCAVKYTPAQGRVTLTASKEGHGVKICVEDTGPGIPQADIPKIFDRLFRGDRSRSEKGLGLGLSMVQAVVRAHNGTIVVENLPDKGTRFTLILP